MEQAITRIFKNQSEFDEYTTAFGKQLGNYSVNKLREGIAKRYGFTTKEALRKRYAELEMGNFEKELAHWQAQDPTYQALNQSPEHWTVLPKGVDIHVGIRRDWRQVLFQALAPEGLSGEDISFDQTMEVLFGKEFAEKIRDSLADDDLEEDDRELFLGIPPEIFKSGDHRYVRFAVPASWAGMGGELDELFSEATKAFYDQHGTLALENHLYEECMKNMELDIDNPKSALRKNMHALSKAPEDLRTIETHNPGLFDDVLLKPVLNSPWLVEIARKMEPIMTTEGIEAAQEVWRSGRSKKEVKELGLNDLKQSSKLTALAYTHVLSCLSIVIGFHCADNTHEIQDELGTDSPKSENIESLLIKKFKEILSPEHSESYRQLFVVGYPDD